MALIRHVFHSFRARRPCRTETDPDSRADASRRARGQGEKNSFETRLQAESKGGRRAPKRHVDRTRHRDGVTGEAFSGPPADPCALLAPCPIAPLPRYSRPKTQQQDRSCVLTAAAAPHLASARRADTVRGVRIMRAALHPGRGGSGGGRMGRAGQGRAGALGASPAAGGPAINPDRLELTRTDSPGGWQP